MTTPTGERTKRLRPVVPRPSATVTRQPDGTRRRQPRLPDPDWPHPPGDRPRFAHHRLAEEFNGGMGVTFRTYADGHVVAYGRASDRDRDGTTRPTGGADDPNDWVAVLWTAHPLLVPDRAHLVRYLTDRASYADALRVLDEWELTG